MWRLLTEERVSYRSLKGDFGLDDESLEELRYFFIEKHALAKDEDGRVLVWAGAVGRTAAAPRPNEDLPPPAGKDMPERLQAPAPFQPHAGAEAATEVSGAERRQLTVMFCDLVGSTRLASRLDPEDMADVIRAYHEAASAIIRRFDGYIAKFMGDGILVYFGFPHAQERDAARAVRTGLSIIEAMSALNAGIGHAKDVHLAVRIGIATGLVMVGESIGADGGAEKTVVGETPNLAARLQALAGSDSIVISAVTKSLAGEEFAYADLGAHELKGIPEPVRAWGVTGFLDRGVEAESDGDGVAQPPLLVGRDEEIGLLRRAWQQSRDERRGQVVMVSGEPGIGKSTLIRSLRAEVQQQRLQRISIRCSQYHMNSALYPVIEHFKRASRWQPEDGAAMKLAKLEHLLSRYSVPIQETAPLMATLMSLAVPEDRYAPLRLTPQQLRQQTADLLVALTLEEAERQPVLQIYEDLHWADPSTLELIGQTIDQVPTAPLLMVLTYRPEFVPPWPHRSHVTPITIGRLERPQIEVLARGLADRKDLPREVLDYIVHKTDGVPLYVEELSKTVLASGILREETGRYVLTGPLSGLSIPASLQEVLMARLDRLPTVREVAQLGAVLGREFAYEMLKAIAVFDEPRLRDGLGQLVDAELLYQRGRPPRATYTFKHALIQDAAYQSLLRRTRQTYHHQVAALLESRFPEIVEAQPELLAHHCAESGRIEAAIAYLHKAGQQAAQRSANQEVVAHATRGLDLLRSHPDTNDQTANELVFQRLLGAALMATKGYAAPETGAAYARARQLCQVVDANQDIYPVLAGVWLFELTRANHRSCREIANDILSRASTANDAEVLLVAHVAAGVSNFYVGAPVPALPHFQRAMTLHQAHQLDPMGYRYGLAFQIAAYSHAAWCEWMLGRPDRALEIGDKGIAVLDEENHPFSVSRGLYHNAVLHQLRGEWSIVQERAELSAKFGTEHGFALVVAASRILLGASHAALASAEAGIRQMRQGLEAYRATGARFQCPYYMVLLADALRASGDVEEGLAVLGEAIAVTEETGERFYEAEAHRVRAALLLARDRGQRAGAAASLRTALEVARRQQARSLELLAARDLAALWAEKGERRKAYGLLAQVYGTFTEGFGTPALASSRELLESVR